MDGGHTRDEDESWDLTLDEEFVRAGRPEASAEQRAAEAQRIAAAHRRASAWRSSSPMLGPASPRRIGRSLVLSAGALLIGAVVVWFFRDTVLVRTPTRLAPPVAAPAGPGPYAFMAEQRDGSGRPVAWDPCRPITYKIRPDGAPPGGEDALRDAIVELERATGLRMIDGGVTDESPRKRPSGLQLFGGTGTPPVVVVWSDEREAPQLREYAGYAGPSHARGSAGHAYWTSGQVVLDREDLGRLLANPRDVAIARAIIMHELGHLAGLTHVNDPTQLMNGSGHAGLTAYQQGDLAGLSLLGRGDCFRQ